MNTAPSPSLSVSRHFRASPERLFDLWTSQDWCRWFGPRGFTCSLVELDPVAGGGYALTMRRPDGVEVAISGVYNIVERPRRLAFSWISGPGVPTMQVEVDFEALGDGTRLTVRQSGFPDDGLRQGYESGWTDEGGTFDKLQSLISERTE